MLPWARTRAGCWLREAENFLRKRIVRVRAVLAGARAPISQRQTVGLAGSHGEVALVGCGPGDPELLTLRALRVLRAADVIVYDHLVSSAILGFARRGARRIYVGKERDSHTLPQDEINALLVRLAREGLRVARLKGGDPFVFGRGGEELQALVRHGIDVQVIPGITAACGIAASTGVPLTHRDYAHSCVFVTGHLRNGTMDLDWEGLARPAQTVVVYMGLKGLPVLARELIRHGVPATTPAMIVARGTLPDEVVITATLEALPQRAMAEAIRPPTMIVVGDVVRVRTTMRTDGAPEAPLSDAARALPLQVDYGSQISTS